MAKLMQDKLDNSTFDNSKFVCVDALHPRQYFFSPVGMFLVILGRTSTSSL